MSDSAILVTGGTGFLGEHLVQILCRDGHGPIRVLARSRSPVIDALAARGAVEVVRGDLLSGDAIDRAMAGCRAVFHLAGQVSRDPDDTRSMMRIHIEGTRRLLDAARQAPVKRVVVASTSGTIAVSKRPEVLDERADHATELVCGWPYYASKVYQERLAFSHGRECGIEIVCVNPSLLLGPGDRRLSSTTDVVRFLRRELPAVTDGGVNFVDVRDAAQATVAALERGRPGERYLIGGPNWTVAEFFGRLSRVAKVPAPRLRLPSGLARVGATVLEHVHRRMRNGGQPPLDRISVEMSQHYWWLDASKAERELGFEARDPGLTLHDTVRYLRQDLGVVD
ncbi:MAG: NAD-dependent epimerase/dehydratase family protein [Myxococcota bacterium]